MDGSETVRNDMRDTPTAIRVGEAPPRRCQHRVRTRVLALATALAALGLTAPAPGLAAAPASAHGIKISAFAPSFDPLDGGHAHFTLDLSHSATAGADAIDMARRMGDGLVHLHLCDGSGASTDEHLVPGRGSQPTVEICQMLAASDFSGHVVLEVTTSRARNAAEREELLVESLEFAREHLLR